MKSKVLIVLGAAQFLMVLDAAVMNVSISQLVADFHTTVTTIQAVITFYSLVMAALMITGGKVGDLLGRRRAFAIGLVIYACGSALTAASWSVVSLALGWSVLEGVGAALVLPALAALVAGNFAGRDRAMAYGVLGGVSGAAIAVGPILGGWVTTNLTWRLVFVGEVVVAALILLGLRWVRDAKRDGPAPKLDVVGAVLSAAALGLIVFGILQSSSWGWLKARNSPVEIFGFSLTLFVIGAGVALLFAFVRWQHHREAIGTDPLVRLAQLKIPPLRSGLWMFLAQNLILMGIFFAVPLYLQVVQGLDAFQTGLHMLPVSITLFVAALAGPRLATRFSPRGVVRVGLVVLVAACVGLLAVVRPSLDTAPFLVAMAVLGVGMGLLVSQLGNVVQSAVPAEGRSEAGGLQYTAQQLGGAIGTALVGAVVIGALAAGFSGRIANDPAISAAAKQQVGVEIEAGVPFLPTSEVQRAVTDAGLSPSDTAAVVDDYAQSQLQALKVGLLLAGAVALGSLAFTAHLPSQHLGATAAGEADEDEEDDPSEAESERSET